ncbi:zinc-ribbon domain-containing protein [bacterium]|nr:zinc-ribbon domain-containing protein [bacterium]
MVLVCPGCKNKITLDDGTLPVGIFKVRCTGCGRSITAQYKDDEPEPPPAPAAAPQPPPGSEVTEKAKSARTSSETTDVSPAVQAFVKDKLGVAKKEILDAIQALFHGAKIGPSDSVEESMSSNRALICSADAMVADALATTLKGMGYQPESCSSAMESLKTVHSSYGIIVVDPVFPDDPEAGKKLIGKINAKKAVDRRQTFLVLISSTQKTLDGNSAFFSGVNLILNKSDLDDFEMTVRQGQKDYHHLYSTFRLIFEEKQNS